MFDSAKKEQQVQIKAMNLMLKEVLAQQKSIVSKLHVTETELLSLSKSKGKDSTHEETRKVVKPCGPRADLNKNVCIANNRQKTCFIELSIEAGILLGGNSMLVAAHIACSLIRCY